MSRASRQCAISAGRNCIWLMSLELRASDIAVALTRLTPTACRATTLARPGPPAGRWCSGGTPAQRRRPPECHSRAAHRPPQQYSWDMHAARVPTVTACIPQCAAVVAASSGGIAGLLPRLARHGDSRQWWQKRTCQAKVHMYKACTGTHVEDDAAGGDPGHEWHAEPHGLVCL